MAKLLWLLALNIVVWAEKRQIFPGTGHSCDVICDEEVHTSEPVCASDGKLYKTPCDLNNAQCLAAHGGNKLIVVSSGACVDLETPCEVALQVRCVPRQVATISGTTDGFEYVCGTNNRTYVCEIGYGINIRHSTFNVRGECRMPNVDPTANFTDFKLFCVNRFPLHKPRCFKSSACEFRTTQCRYQQIPAMAEQLTFAHYGECVLDTSNAYMVNCSTYIHSETSGLAIEGGTNMLPHPIACPRNFDPICTQDGRTFSNECTFCSFLLLSRHLEVNTVAYARHKGQCTRDEIIG